MQIEEVKKFLHTLFTIKDLGKASYFLGIEMLRNEKGLFLSQLKYAMDILSDVGLQNAKPVVNPCDHGIILSESGEKLTDPSVYRKIVGRLLYLGFTRPDISFATQQLSQYMQEPCKHHLTAAFHVLKYIRGTINMGLFYPSQNNLKLTAYADADWGRCPITRRSLTGYCVFLGAALVSWKTKKQMTVSKSSTEAEYRSMAMTACEIKWLSFLLKDFQVKVQTPISLYCDNQAAMAIARNPVFHERTKHVEIDAHLIRENVEAGFISTCFVSTKAQLADLFTKPISSSNMAPALQKMGVVHIEHDK